MPIAFDLAQGDFAEQATFFWQKLNLPTDTWRDVLRGAHDRAFVVAGAQKADLLADLRSAVDRSIREGKSLQWFQDNFDQIVARHGWDHTGDRAWRAKVIYQTNMLTSYAAGRQVQLRQAAEDGLWWMYRHSDSVMHPRPLHVSWDKLCLPASHTWWRTHYPPNGWGCACYVVAVHPSRLPAGAKTTAPDDGTDPRSGGPAGIDEGWNYAPGAQVADDVARLVAEKAASLAARDAAIARAHVAELARLPAFETWISTGTAGEWPVAVLDDALREAIQSDADLVWLSAETVDKQAKHPEIGPAEYRLVQHMLDAGEIYAQGDDRIVTLWEGERFYRAALKRTQAGDKNYFLTLFETLSKKAEKEVRGKLKRIR